MPGDLADSYRTNPEVPFPSEILGNKDINDMNFFFNENI